jgi:hypothetical protein
LSESPVSVKQFVEFFRERDLKIALSDANLVELSRAPRGFPERDAVFQQLKHSLFLPTLYGDLIEAEIAAFPRRWDMRWVPLERLMTNDDVSLLAQLSSSALFKEARESLFIFGEEHFMNLEELKKNFPPLRGDTYNPEDVSFFVWGSSVDFLTRQFPHFFRSQKARLKKGDFAMLNGLRSLQARLWFLFYKYYLHGQSPQQSDFMDFVHISYVPYVNVFVTEKNVRNVLQHLRQNPLSQPVFGDTAILHINDFYAQIEKT